MTEKLKKGIVVQRKEDTVDCNGISAGHYYSVWKPSSGGHVKMMHLEDSRGGVQTGKLNIIRQPEDFSVGDIVRRTGPTINGSNGRCAQEELYQVHDMNSRKSHLAFFNVKASGKLEEPCWEADKFVIVIPVEAIHQGQEEARNFIQQIRNGICVEPAVNEPKKAKKKKADNKDYEIEDVEFSSLSKHYKMLILKGKCWICSVCDSHNTREQHAANCCHSDLIKYCPMPDEYYWSSSKQEPVEIRKMMSMHLSNAINKLEKEGDDNDYYHLLPALIAEANRRELSSIIEGDDDDDFTL